MTTNFKEILLKIGRLSKSDQRWIIAKLSKTEKAVYSKLQGEKLLSKARLFRTLNKEMPLPLKEPLAPPDWQSLANYCSLYIAIVLEQGQFLWQEQFLGLFDQKDEIKMLFSSDRLKQLTTSTKQAVYQQWEKNQNFDSYLEQHHG
ncbi:MAG: hypothetical protein H0T84_12930 [Tatlockia sp.]|nr:hypothetical protein [Tatlockia sp.]